MKFAENLLHTPRILTKFAYKTYSDLNYNSQTNMTNEYYILEIYTSEDGRYGNIFVVEANPVEIRPGGKVFVEHHCSGTEIFFFPRNDALIQPILRIAQSHGFWSPNPDDYEDDDE